MLLDLTRAIFEEQSSLDNIVHKIMMSTQSFLQCERCSVLLVDPTSKVNSFHYLVLSLVNALHMSLIGSLTKPISFSVVSALV